MDKKKVTIFVDTNVFIIDLRYHRDINFKKNREFLDFLVRHGKGMTSIINLLEVCGILSFNLNQQQILELFYYFPEKYKVDIIPSYDMDSLLLQASVKAMMDIISQKASFGDALIANHVNHFFKENTVFVSWDALHFKNLLSVKALTPREFLQSKEPL